MSQVASRVFKIASHKAPQTVLLLLLEISAQNFEIVFAFLFDFQYLADDNENELARTAKRPNRFSKAKYMSPKKEIKDKSPERIKVFTNS